MWTLHKKIESQMRGDPDDSSESWEDQVTYYLVRADEEDEFQESLADDYGSQDYNYRVECRGIAKFSSDGDLLAALDCISQRVFIEKLKEEKKYE